MANTPLERAIEIVGKQATLGEMIGYSQKTISFWIHKKPGWVPAEAVLPIERATDGEVSRYELRPDLYPKDDCPCRKRRRKKQ